MTLERQQLIAEKQQPTAAERFVTATLTNFEMQIPRTLLNYAADTKYPWQTAYQAFNVANMPSCQPLSVLKHAITAGYRGAHWNIARGTASLYCGTLVQDSIKAHYGKDTFTGKALGLAGATMVSAAIGVSIETIFIRRNKGLLGTRITLPLTGAYLLREAFFYLYITSSDLIPPTYHPVAQLGVTITTGLAHQQIVRLATDVVTPTKYFVNPIIARGAFLGTYKSVYEHNQGVSRAIVAQHNAFVGRLFKSKSCPRGEPPPISPQPLGSAPELR